jgi:hypothetical protein
VGGFSWASSRGRASWGFGLTTQDVSRFRMLRDRVSGHFFCWHTGRASISGIDDFILLCWVHRSSVAVNSVLILVGRSVLIYVSFVALFAIISHAGCVFWSVLMRCVPWNETVPLLQFKE